MNKYRKGRIRKRCRAEKRKKTDKEHESDRDIQTDRRALTDWSQIRLLKSFLKMVYNNAILF